MKPEFPSGNNVPTKLHPSVILHKVILEATLQIKVPAASSLILAPSRGKYEKLQTLPPVLSFSLGKQTGISDPHLTREGGMGQWRVGTALGRGKAAIPGVGGASLRRQVQLRFTNRNQPPRETGRALAAAGRHLGGCYLFLHRVSPQTCAPAPRRPVAAFPSPRAGAASGSPHGLGPGSWPSMCFGLAVPGDAAGPLRPGRLGPGRTHPWPRLSERPFGFFSSTSVHAVEPPTSHPAEIWG